ncbi:hypothetical protein CHGG_08100 [Chaetomium globosum CBS 148.51]|uniref:Amino acid permease/ SLC12A domain-containing protein n=1 Tax=Chaetomium globosum (strain ATCC 6205 / CBS 148.51 / DSM 1962 / NBRC 6347 / NRRL 1970) TaxID=306901 RepID=Q2GVA4_CHAGB|nr:uncharacterized protein CHGG_08100 [Chaetomium globosum CBS 148.51]EAQ86847.1 hypothetical protein CHGG_08100 [Chaetomium globosum CBS 148.51]
MVVLPLGLNIFGMAFRLVDSFLLRATKPRLCLVTLLNDSMGYIHSCSLRWSLQREGKLDFNSNLRLLTSPKHSRPNGMIPNAVYLIGIVLSYGSTSLIFLSLNPELARLLGKDYDSDDIDGVHINPVALFTLGAGFLLQAIITNWALVETNIPTWSSNPLDVARVCTVDEHDGHRVEPRIGRCMMSVHLAKEDARWCKPRPKQGPMITAHSHVRRILILLWILPILSGIWGSGVYGYLLKGSQNNVFGRSWSLLPIFTGSTDSNCSTHQCTDGTSVVNVGWTANGAAGVVGAVFLIMAFQSVVTLSLHCAELIVNLSRDEKVYRGLLGLRGTNGHHNSVLAAFTSWQTLFLFALKAGVHWMFGLAINLQFQLGVNMHPPQIFYFSAFCLAAAIFGLLLSVWRPAGYLPAAYGHIQTIADVVDEWADSGAMFWGEKKAGNPGYTGTSTHRLKQPDERMWYGGQPEHRSSQVRDSAVPTELYNLAPSNATPPIQPFFYPTTPPPYPPAGPPHMQHNSYSQWAQQAHQQAQNRPSHHSLNSAFSGMSGYSYNSNYSAQSTQPFLGNQRAW